MNEGINEKEGMITDIEEGMKEWLLITDYWNLSTYPENIYL